MSLKCFKMFPLYSIVNQLYVYIHPFFFGFPFHLGHHRALSRVPCAIQQVLVAYLFYTQHQQCIHVSPNLSNLSISLPISPFAHLVPIHLSSTSVSLFLLCKQVHLYRFPRFLVYVLMYDVCFYLSYFALYITSQVHPLFTIDYK